MADTFTLTTPFGHSVELSRDDMWAIHLALYSEARLSKSISEKFGVDKDRAEHLNDLVERVPF